MSSVLQRAEGQLSTVRRQTAALYQVPGRSPRRTDDRAMATVRWRPCGDRATTVWRPCDGGRVAAVWRPCGDRAMATV